MHECEKFITEFDLEKRERVKLRRSGENKSQFSFFFCFAKDGGGSKRVDFSFAVKTFLIAQRTFNDFHFFLLLHVSARCLHCETYMRTFNYFFTSLSCLAFFMKS